MDEQLLESYVTNSIRIDLGALEKNVLLELRPEPAGIPRSTWVWHVVSAWNPNGRPTSAGENVARHEERLENEALARGWGKYGATVLAADLSWGEGALALTGADDKGVATVAKLLGQPAFWRWDIGGLHVLEAVSGRRLRTVPVSVVRRIVRPCPMRANQELSEVCTRPGGPWTSSSIEAAGIWERDRAALLAATKGCDICNRDAVHGAPGRPILLAEWSVASRYGRPVVLKYRNPPATP